MTEHKWNTYKKFTFVKNPYDRIVSSWLFLTNIKQIDNVTFEEFLTTKNTIHNYAYFHSFMTQYDNILNSNNENDLYYIGHSHTLNEDLCHILLDLGIDKIKHRHLILEDVKFNNTTNKQNYTSYYNDNCISTVNDLFKDDFKHFKFEAVNTIEQLQNNCMNNNYYQNDLNFTKSNIQIIKKLDKTNQIISMFENSQLINNNNDSNNNDSNTNNNIISDNKVVLDNGIILDIPENISQNNKPTNIKINYDLIKKHNLAKEGGIMGLIQNKLLLASTDMKLYSTLKNQGSDIPPELQRKFRNIKKHS